MVCAAAGSRVWSGMALCALGCAYGNEVAPTAGGADATDTGGSSASTNAGGAGGSPDVGAAGPGGGGGLGAGGAATGGAGTGGCDATCVVGDACVTTCGTAGSLACADPCAPTCAPPAESCNGADDDCNASCDDGPVAGCRVGVHRAYGVGGHLFTTDLAQASGWGMLEAQNNFYLYAASNPSVVPLYRCSKNGTANTLLTTNAGCEGVGAQLGTLGFLSSTAVCSSAPIHRLSLPTENWHFYTMSDAERDSAVAGGWLSEGVLGHVWTAP